MFTRKEIRIVLISAFITLSTICILDKLFITHNINATTDTTDISAKFTHLSIATKDAQATTTKLALQENSNHPSLLPSKTTLYQQTSLSASHNNKITFDSLIPPNSQCSNEIIKSYQKSNQNNQNHLQWCKQKQVVNKVNIGRSWGSLSKSDKQLWDTYKCNELLTIGKLQSCDQRWGWNYFKDWSDNVVNVVEGSVSNVTCMKDLKTSTFCQYNNIILDYSKMHTHTTTRSFSEGFFTVYGKMHNYGYSQNIPGFVVQDEESIDTPVSESSKNGQGRMDSHKRMDSTLERMHSNCDIIETRPTFILSNDDIYNLGHYYNDLIGIWGMLTLSKINSKNAILLNIDGYRKNGPAGVGSHRIMLPGQPDEHGPYIQYYKSWFSEVKKAKDFGMKRVCYKQLFLPPTPGIPWFWNEWSAINECSLQAPSPLYQSFNLFMRYHWNNAYSSSSGDSTSSSDSSSGAGNNDISQKGLTSTTTTITTSTTTTGSNNTNNILQNPPTDIVHIVIEVRAINPSKRNNHSSGRHISNLYALIEALKTIPGVKITAQDFAKISFNEQVALAHTAGVFISMHGAGTTHIFHSAIGQPNCCALIELFPDPTIELHTAQGYGNLARQLGFYHYRNVADIGKTRAQGTEVDITAIYKLAIQAIDAVRTKPTCLHNIYDTTYN